VLFTFLDGLPRLNESTPTLNQGTSYGGLCYSLQQTSRFMEVKHMKNRVLSCLALLALIGTASAVEPVALPDTGVDLSGYVASLTTTLGGQLGLAIGAGFALFALWMGFKYIKSATRGK